MNRLSLAAAAVCLTTVSPAFAAIMYEDLDPDASTPVSNNLTITAASGGGRTGVGDVDVSTGTAPFMAILTDPTTFDVSGLNGLEFSGSIDTYIPGNSTINQGDSIYLQIDFFNSVIGSGGAGNFTRFTAGFFGPNAQRDVWSTISRTDVVPDLTPNGAPVDRVNVAYIFTDGGFGGTPNDAAAGTFAYVDNVRFSVVPEPASLAIVGLGVGALLLAGRARRDQ